MKNNMKKFKKIFTYISKLISTAALIILIIVGTFLVYYLISAKMVASNPEYRPKVNLYTIVSGSMQPNINVYDIVVDYMVDKPEDIKVGDVITFVSTSNISKNLIVTHRVIEIKQVNGQIEYVTKGDYNATSDGDTAKFDNVIGKVILRFPQLGRLQFFLATKMGWFIVVLLPALGVIIYDIIKVIKLVKLRNTTDQISDAPNNNKNDKVNYDKEIINKSLDQIRDNDYEERLNKLKNYKNRNY